MFIAGLVLLALGVLCGALLLLIPLGLVPRRIGNANGLRRPGRADRGPWSCWACASYLGAKASFSISGWKPGVGFPVLA